jgi:hypothetical protein
LILAANRFFRGTVEAANKVLHQYGLSMADSEDHAAGEVLLDTASLAAHDLMLAVTQLTFRRASPVSVTDPQVASLLARTAPGAKTGFVALAHCDRGEVVALGQSLWWSWVNAEQCDNARFVQNLLNTPIRP